MVTVVASLHLRRLAGALAAAYKALGGFTDAHNTCRVCVVNNVGAVLLDSHVAQRERVTDFRTRFSGVRPSDLAGAPSLEEVAGKVAAMVKGRVIVGHAITNDLTVSRYRSQPRTFCYQLNC